MLPPVRRLHPLFVAELSGVDLRASADEDFERLRGLLDEFAVLVVRDQPFEDAEQLAFARRFDGDLHTKSGRAVMDAQSRLGDAALTDISNLDEAGQPLAAGDRRRMYALGNRLWHTDATFQHPPGRYSLLSCKSCVERDGETEYADMRAAYDSLPPHLQEQIAGLRAFHSIVYSRQTIGFSDFTPDEAAELPGAEQPLVRVNPRTGRMSLYLASHASHVIGWPVPEGRLLLRELTSLATRPELVYRHQWQVGDFVLWDNRATMHRGLAFDESQPRDLRRVTTLDREPASAATR